jgi:hypothetical protein
MYNTSEIFNTKLPDVPNTSQIFCVRHIIILILIRNDKSTVHKLAPLHTQSNSHSASYTQGCYSPLASCPFKGMEQRHKYAST